MVNFLILLILHILGDFYLQTSKIAKCKSASIDVNCDKCKNCKKEAFLTSNILLFIRCSM